MDDKHVDASTAMQQREGGYGGELHIKWSALEDEIRQSIMPMPDVASLRSTHQVRSDSTLTQEEMKQELVLSQQINYHFSSLKANYRGIQSCEWMRGVQLQGTWCRLGDPKTVHCLQIFSMRYILILMLLNLNSIQKAYEFHH